MAYRGRTIHGHALLGYAGFRGGRPKLLFPSAPPLDLLFLFSYSAAYEYSAFSQVLRGLLQKVRPRRVSWNRQIPCQRHLCGVLALRRKAAVSALRGHSWQASFRGQEKAAAACGPRGRAAWPHVRSHEIYFGKGARVIARPSRAERLAASRICITTTLVSSEVRSPLGCSVPVSTAAR